MAGGWSKDGAVQEQIDSTVEDAVQRVRSNMPQGNSRKYCSECGEPIPQARREAIPGVQFCVTCQSGKDAQQRAQTGFNRRGSKDSQLR